MMQAFSPSISNGTSQVALPIAAIYRQMLDQCRLLGGAALMVVRPVPGAGRGEIRRALACTTAPVLNGHRAVIESGPGQVSLAIDIALASDSTQWSQTLFREGYKRAFVVRVPLDGCHCMEFSLLSLAATDTGAGLPGFCHAVLSSWSHCRLAVREEHCPLSAREREALQAVASGMNGVEAAADLGCMERTFRMHVDNAKKKLGASSAAEAAHRAQLLCAF